MNITSVSITPIASLLALFCCFAVAFFVLFKDKNNHLNQSFSLITIFAGIWTAFPFLIWLPEEYENAFLIGKIVYLFAPFVPTAFFYFVGVFLHIHKNSKEKNLARLFLLISLLFAFISFHPYFIEGIRREEGLYTPIPGPLYLYFSLFFGVVCGLAFYQCFMGYRQSTGARKNQIKYVLTSFAFAYSAGLMHFIGTFFHVEPFPHDFLLILFAGTITYAIAKHRLMDIKVVMHKGLTYSILLCGTLIPAYIGVTITQRATTYSLPPLFSATIIFSLGLWIFLQKPRSVTNLTLWLLSLSCSVWQFSFFMIYSEPNSKATLFWTQVMYVGIIYIPAFVTHFVWNFLKLTGSRLQTTTPYLLSTGFLLLLPTPYFLNGQHTYYWGNYPKAGPLFLLFLVYFYSSAALSLRRLYDGYKSRERVNPNEGVRIKYVFFSFLTGFAASIDFIQTYKVELYPIGFIFITLWIFLVSFATAKYQVLEIPLTLPKNTIFWYVRQFAIILIFYFAIVAIIWSFTGTKHFVLTAILLASFSIFSELVLPLQKNMERAIGQTFFKQRNDALKTLTTFSHDLVAILDLNDLNTRFLHTLSRALGVSALSLFIFEKEKDLFSLAASHGMVADSIQDQTFSPQHVLPNYFHTHSSILIREELENIQHLQNQQELFQALNLLEAELCLPLINKDRLVGFCNLGPRTSREMYSEEELSLLTALAQNAALALDHALLYEDWKRSQLLMKRTDRLRSLETIAGGFAHEIRNPLTSIKTFIQLAPERRNDGEFITDFSRVVNEDVNRIERLIEEVLDYARYMKPRLTEEDLNEIVSSCLYFVQVKAGNLGITLEQDLSPDLPYVMVDRQQFKQVLLNLLLNALEAIAKTPGKIKISTHRLFKDTKEEWVQIKVSDTGPGISPTNLEHIFDPFYTTKHESGEHEGTGLGLAIVHQIIQEHHGIIHVESRLGSGTTFFVDIPANPCHATPQTVMGGT